MADPDATTPVRPHGAAPALRASDADRERTAERLRLAASEGRLSFEELDERLDAAYAARTGEELRRLLADVTVDDAEEPLPAPARGGAAVRPGAGGTSWVVAVMSGQERKGHWRLARRCTVLNVMGGSELDLNDVELAAEAVELTVVSIMGGGDIYVPEGMDVEVSEFALMGGNGVDLGARRRHPGAPRIHIRLVSIMGGTDVKRGRKLTRAERKARERERRGVTRGEG
jgi:uncharacterized protein DUF1707